jgi:predicted lipoprotein with Yx(FWY)xxD motif
MNGRPWAVAGTAIVLLAGCASGGVTNTGTTTPEASATSTHRTEAAPTTTAPSSAPVATGVVITVGDSDYGPMLFDERGQAIYLFDKETTAQPACYGECAAAWPPVYTRGEPRAAGGVRASLLGSIRRRDGRRQVTYAGRPLYYYAHEKPGEVRCHNVDLNGGLWWVVGRDGRRRP